MLDKTVEIIIPPDLLDRVFPEHRLPRPGDWTSAPRQRSTGAGRLLTCLLALAVALGVAELVYAGLDAADPSNHTTEVSR